MGDVISDLSNIWNPDARIWWDDRLSGRKKLGFRESYIGGTQLTVSALTAESWDRIKEKNNCWLLKEAIDFDEECTVIPARDDWRKTSDWRKRREQGRSTLQSRPRCLDETLSTA